MFKAEKFDTKEWLELFEEAGAKFFMPVAEHHDGFQMYDSELSDWNSVKMGPQRDLLGEMKAACEEQGIVFCASSHRAENYWFMCGLRDFDSGLQDIEFQEPYGFADKLFEHKDRRRLTHMVDSPTPNEEHLKNWLARSCELVDKYQPRILWFDWWIQNKAFKPYLKKFAAYYYNRAAEWGVEVAINYKYDAYARGTAIFDVERGQLGDIRPLFWQTDTAVARNSWCYSKGNDYKSAQSLVCCLIDIVSKNGALLLNIGPKADGTIPDEDAQILKDIGKWLKINGESIYNTRYWSTYGEGPTETAVGSYTDGVDSEYTSQDMRFTYNAPYVYVNVLKFPADKKVLIKSMRTDGEIFSGLIDSIEVLGSDMSVSFNHTAEGLEVEFSENMDTDYPVCLKVKID